jgi:hypothetical protein
MSSLLEARELRKSYSRAKGLLSENGHGPHPALGGRVGEAPETFGDLAVATPLEGESRC